MSLPTTNPATPPAISGSPWIAALLLGVWATAVALVRTPEFAVLLLAPCVVIPIVWWLVHDAEAWLVALFAAVLVLPPLPVALGDSGPHPALLLAAAGLVVGGLRFKEWRAFRDPLAYLFCLFCAALLASALSAVFYSGATIAALSVARIALFCISVYVYLYAAHGPAARWGSVTIVRWLLAAGILAALFAWADFYYQFPAPAGYGAQFVWLSTGVFRRAQGLFYEASTLGNCCAFFLVMIAVSWVQGRELKIAPRWLLLASAALFSVVLLISYSRASAANVAVALLTLAAMRSQKRSIWSAMLAAGLTIGVAIGCAYIFVPAFVDLYVARLMASLQYAFSETNGVLSGRLDAWRIAGDLVASQPSLLLTGAGYKTLPYSTLAGRALIVDNMYFSLLLETGVVGLIVFLGLQMQILRSAWTAAKAPSPRAAFFGTWLFCFWIGELVQMLSGDLFTYWRVLPLYFWVLAMAGRELRADASR